MPRLSWPKAGVPVRVVSMPSTTVFDRQPLDYKKSVLPVALPCVAVEAGVTDGWWKYGVALSGIDTYGESVSAGDCSSTSVSPTERGHTVKVALGAALIVGVLNFQLFLVLLRIST